MTRPAWTQLIRWLGLVTSVTFVVVVVGGTLVWIPERHAPGSNLQRWGDCLWWSVTTLATVGYGEHYPITFRGRLVAVGIMMVGVAVIGAVAAVVAFAFASRLTARLEAAVHQSLLVNGLGRGVRAHIRDRQVAGPKRYVRNCPF